MSTLGRKLFIIAPSAYPLGGTADWLDYLVMGLISHGWNVTVGLLGGKFHNIERYVNQHALPNVYPIVNKAGTRLGRQYSLIRALKKIRPDLVLSVNCPDAQHAIRLLRAQGKCHLRSAIALHGLQSDGFFDLHENKDVIEGVIATNKLVEVVANNLSALPRDAIFYAPTGVRPPTNQPPTNQQKNGSQTFNIGYIGRLDNLHKRVMDIPGILRNLKSHQVTFRLILAGDGPDKERLLERLALEDIAFEYLGPISKEELSISFYNKIDCLLITSMCETGPIVLWEAWSHKKPVVSSNYIGSGLEGALQNKKNCLTYPIGDTKVAAQAMLTMSERDLQKNLGEVAYQTYLATYTIEHSIDYWHNALQTICQNQIKPIDRSRLNVSIGAGRLESLVGGRLATVLRQFLPNNYVRDAGDEWPHSYGHRDQVDSDYWKQLSLIDSRQTTSNNYSPLNHAAHR